jgi:hypothetical protein
MPKITKATLYKLPNITSALEAKASPPGKIQLAEMIHSGELQVLPSLNIAVSIAKEIIAGNIEDGWVSLYPYETVVAELMAIAQDQLGLTKD